MIVTPSGEEFTGISVHVADPLWVANRRPDLGSITEFLSSYSHKSSAFIGFDEASPVMSAGLEYAQEWYDRGLGRDFRVYSEGGREVWRGFVNAVEVTAGNKTARRGPLLDIGNRVYAMYNEKDASTTPPTILGRTVTTIVEDEDSQDKWGIIEKALVIGTATTSDAEKNRDTFLAEHKEPESSGPISTQTSSAPVVTLEVKGYGYWLDAYVYNQTATNLSVTISDLIKAILAADPNGIISTDYSLIDENAWLVNNYEDKDPKALTKIKEQLTLGDVNDVRWLFMILGDNIARYHIRPSTVKYHRSLADDRIKLSSDDPVRPWEIMPGEWSFLTDWLPDKELPTVVEKYRDDGRFEFVESVTYTAPFSYSIEGSRTDTLPMSLAKLMLAEATA